MPGRKPSASFLERSQKKLYLAVRKELALYERKKPKELLAYERSFRATLPRRLRSSNRKRLLGATEGADVVLVGDFHPFRQSQKGFLRLLEGAMPRGGDGSAVALECFQQAHQAAVNEYLAGLITADELRDKIDFEHYWPFSWESYREILAFAKRHHLAVIALNIAGRRGKPDLRNRDAAAADRIAGYLEAHPAATVFTLYGELHLGCKHLPADLRAALGGRRRLVTVHQNDIELYWRAPTGADGQRPEVLELGKGEFCILNSVPWVKLRSYLDWLEGSPAPDVDESELDVVEIVHHDARLLADAVGLSVSIDDTVEIFPPDRLGLRGLASGFRALGRPDRDLALHALHFQRPGYLPNRSALILPAVSTNSMAEAGAMLLRHTLLSARKASASRWRTDDWVSHFLLGYLGSKVLNPKRKCNEVADLKRMVGLPPRGRSAHLSVIARRALTLLRPWLRDTLPGQRTKRLPLSQEIEACRAAGFVLGERFFLALLAHPELFERLRTMFRAESAEEVLAEAEAGIAKLRRVGRSKRERF